MVALPHTLFHLNMLLGHIEPVTIHGDPYTQLVPSLHNAHIHLTENIHSPTLSTFNLRDQDSRGAWGDKPSEQTLCELQWNFLQGS